MLPESAALAPEPGAAKLTVTPLSRFPLASFTVACRVVPNGVETTADCGVPPVAVRVAGGPVVLVRENVVETPCAPAVMEYDPGNALAVAVTLAMPWELVTAVPAERVALAPVAGAVNVMLTPLCGVPVLSLKSTWSAAAKGVATVVLCGVPPVAAILGGGMAELVSEKPAVKEPTLAVTE